MSGSKSECLSFVFVYDGEGPGPNSYHPHRRGLREGGRAPMCSYTVVGSEWIRPLLSQDPRIFSLLHVPWSQKVYWYTDPVLTGSQTLYTELNDEFFL